MTKTSIKRVAQGFAILLVATGMTIALSVLPDHVAGNAFVPVPTIPTSTALDPTYFAPGACVALAPTHEDRHATVFLDAGHGGIDPGAVGSTETGQAIDEAQETLPIELDAASLLRALGYRVVVSRTGSSTVVALKPGEESDGVLTLQGAHDDVAARDVCADLAGAAVLIGIYLDAGASPDNAGCLTAYDAVRPFSAQNLRLADLLQRDLLAQLNSRGWQIPNDGVQADGGLGSISGSPADGGLAAAAASYDHLLLLGPAAPGYFSTPSLMPGVVTEPLFITDPAEATTAASTSGQMAVAQALAQAVQQFLAGSPPPT